MPTYALRTTDNNQGNIVFSGTKHLRWYLNDILEHPQAKDVYDAYHVTIWCVKDGTVVPRGSPMVWLECSDEAFVLNTIALLHLNGQISRPTTIATWAFHQAKNAEVAKTVAAEHWCRDDHASCYHGGMTLTNAAEDVRFREQTATNIPSECGALPEEIIGTEWSRCEDGGGSAQGHDVVLVLRDGAIPDLCDDKDEREDDEAHARARSQLEDK